MGCLCGFAFDSHDQDGQTDKPKSLKTGTASTNPYSRTPGPAHSGRDCPAQRGAIGDSTLQSPRQNRNLTDAVALTQLALSGPMVHWITNGSGTAPSRAKLGSKGCYWAGVQICKPRFVARSPRS
jgi:hypothetical protein